MQYEGVTISEGEMNIRAERQASVEPATEFASGIDASNAMSTCGEIDLMPDELDFVVYGNIKF